MNRNIKEKPRDFESCGVTIKDFGKVCLDSDEMISMVSASGKECDVTAKEWGFYLAPSINGRLKKQGFRVALVLNREGKLFINAVEDDKIELFRKYLKTDQDSKILCWLDEWQV